MVKPFGVTGVMVMVGIIVFATTATVCELQHPFMVLQKEAVYVPGALAHNNIGVPVGPTIGVLEGSNHVPKTLVVVELVAVKVLQPPLQVNDWVIGLTEMVGMAVLDDTAKVIVVMQEPAVASWADMV